jgi:hypothetical protein
MLENHQANKYEQPYNGNDCIQQVNTSGGCSYQYS